jgi:deoxyribodipyrimidine photolyase-like uncharacterized protein
MEEFQIQRISQQQRLKAAFQDLVQNRGHVIEEIPKNFHSHASVSIHCMKHNRTFLTTVTNYKRAKTGLPCCGRQNQSEKGTWEYVNKKRAQRKKQNAGEVN